MKILTNIQIILTVFLIVAVVVNFKMAVWLHSLAYNDPAREEWRPFLEVLWFGSTISWLLFTLFHVIFILVDV